MDKALEQLIEMVREASPALWAAAQNKVTAMMIAAVVWGVIWSGIAWAGFKLKRKAEGLPDEPDEFVVALAWILLCIGWMGVVYCVGDLICIVIARDWYALEALTRLSPVR